MDEDSKELAEAGSYGERLHLHAPMGMTGAELGKKMGKALLKNARSLAKGGALLGHVKAIARTDSGFVKVSVVDLTLGPELDTDIADKEVGTGMFNIMAAVAGHDDDEVKRAVEAMLEDLSRTIELHEDHKEKGHTHIVELG